MTIKKYLVTDTSGRPLKVSNALEGYEAAVDYAKRYAKDYEVLHIYGLTATVKTPVPDAVVEKL